METRTITIDDELYVRDTQFVKLDWSGQEASHVDLGCVHVSRTRLTQVSFDDFRASDLLFEDCDLSGADLTESTMSRVEFRGCKMTGVVLSGSRIRWVSFIDCRLDMALFRGLEAEDCRFKSCDLKSGDFEMATIERASFSKCMLSDASFRQARLKEVDLRSSELTDLRYAQGLKGATIESVQLLDLAASLAAEIGIRIIDEIEPV